MVVPNKDVIKYIGNLIYEITGFRRDEENFDICERYCLSHVMHHTYPSVNKNAVKKQIDGYIHRFFIHGYFKVADGLKAQVEDFLSSELLFKNNSEGDIQWVLLSLLTCLSSNLSAISKVPKMIQVIEDEKPLERINWGEYLKEGQPNFQYQSSDEDDNSDNLSFYSQNSDSFTDCEESESTIELQERITDDFCVTRSEINVFSMETLGLSRQHIIDDLIKRREEELRCDRDIALRGNFIKEYSSSQFLTNSERVFEVPDVLSEFVMVGYILKQFLTGENVFKRKGLFSPATCSLTPGTVRNYLSSIQPHTNIIAVFKDFINEVSCYESGQMGEEKLKTELHCIGGDAAHLKKIKSVNNLSTNQTPKRSIPNVMKLYVLALTEALHPFETKILSMSERQNSYTILKVLHELRPSFIDLNSLYSVHLSAIADWPNQPNWLCSVRIIMALYRAVLHSSSNRMGFLYMNMFLHCFQAYLDITDSWISCLRLNDLHDEYIIYRLEGAEELKTYCVRPYKEELSKIGIKDIPVLDILVDKMIHVGHSIDVLNQLDSSLIKDKYSSIYVRGSLYKQLLTNLKREIKAMADALVLRNDIENLVVEKKRPFADDQSFGDSKKTEDEHFSSQNDTNGRMSKDLALGSWCTQLWENDKSGVIERSIWPLASMTVTATKILVKERVHNTCDIAKSVVVNEFQLKIHLRLLRNIFLFNDPHLIQPFMTAFFGQTSLWRNGYALTFCLRECIEHRFKCQTEYLSVSMKDNSVASPKNVLEAIDGLTINYQVNWPLKLIFTPLVMTLYNDVFRHLMKLHWAHEALCKLQFIVTYKDLQSSEMKKIVKTSCRRLELLRFWCLGLLARLRTYFMAQISIPFDLQLNNYQHLTHIIKAHETFISKIHSRCLFDDLDVNGKELIFKILIPLCNDVYQCWCSGEVRDTRLTVIENSFFKSQKQFSRLMARLEQE